MTRARRLCIVSAIVVVAAGSAACGKAERDINTLRSAISRTQQMPRQFVYSDVSANRSVEVRGLVDDAFRYKARLSFNKNDAWDEVVSDDALAERFIEPGILPSFVRNANTASGTSTGNPPSSPIPRTPNEITGSPFGSASPETIHALQSRQWVIDDAGAPSLLPRGNEHHIVGDDPLYDAVTALRYADATATGAFKIEKFSPENLDYKASEDPFPKPGKNSGIARFDYLPPPLPHPNQGAGGTAVPQIPNFRKMSVYVKDGLVVEIRERIDVAARLRDLTRIYGLKFPRGSSTKEQIDIAVAAMNDLHRGQGTDPIVVRERVVKFTELGQDQPVALPTDNVVKGDLGFLINRGRQQLTTTTTTAGTTQSG